jgi:uncharacterized protein YjbI with pentapeptide repeats
MTEKPNPFDVGALERSLNDSATRVSTIWVSYLIFALYLLIATGTVTDRQLLFAEPLKLPVLNIDLPFFWFFVIAPMLLVLLHIYVLLQVLLLGRTAAAYNETVNRLVDSPPENALMRQRLVNTLFAQIFAGSPRERKGWLGSLLRAMAWITLVPAPIYVVLAFLFVFLPYHSHFATWTHRLLLFAELAVALLLWPLVLDARRDLNWRKLLRRVKRTAAIPLGRFSAKDLRRMEWQRLRQQAAPMVACISFVAVSLSFASFPGEPHVNLFTGKSPFAVQCDRWITFQTIDRLKLEGVDVVDEEKFDKIEKFTASKGQRAYEGKPTRSFRERDLSCAVFDFAILRRADFSDARMSGASFTGAELQGARLNARLQGAKFNGAGLQGAYLSFAQLQGANLRAARLQGADLTAAQLQGAYLYLAQLQGADLSVAQLQGADLSSAQLQGAVLSFAQLQGAVLLRSKLRLALISDAYLWRVRYANCTEARVTTPKLDAAQFSTAPLTTEVIENFVKDAVVDIDNDQKDAAVRRLREGLLTKEDDLAATAWRNCASDSEKFAMSDYLRQLADLVRDVVCDARIGRKEIATQIVNRIWEDGGSLANHPDYRLRLARGLLGHGKDCAATKDLSDEAKERLHADASTPEPTN